MAKNKTEKVKVKAQKSSPKGGSGGNKKKIIVAVVVVIIIILAVVFFFVLRKEDDGNGDGDGNLDPVAEFTYPLEIYANRTVTFNALNSTDPDGDDLEYSWDFGDPHATSEYPNTATGVKPPHRYTIPGTYNVTLTVEDGEGGIDEASSEITVLPEETPTVSLNFLKPNNSITNIVWKLIVDLTDGTEEQLALSNIRYNIYNGSDTNDVKLTGIITVNPASKVSHNNDDIYFDDYEDDSVLSVLDFFSIAGDGGGPYPVESGDNFQLIYEPNQGAITNPEPLG
ncbi:MAG: PKD domain-containing protein [Thermoplasmata archaeon]